MKRSGSADLPLHYGFVPRWLSERMAKLHEIAVKAENDFIADNSEKIMTGFYKKKEMNRGNMAAKLFAGTLNLRET